VDSQHPAAQASARHVRKECRASLAQHAKHAGRERITHLLRCLTDSVVPLRQLSLKQTMSVLPLVQQSAVTEHSASEHDLHDKQACVRPNRAR
jgi:hypothetical protein